ncbi:SulP family inorganic anion transporter [Paenibacillus ferrarius]|uniref:SulP family inorganic anion transporter n=1 Tax=Paenibacillus ferrarius TaxID=1469647 RepID=UPI003D27AF0B
MKGIGRFAGYNAAAFRNDAVSGLIVGIIAIPLGMAFAIATGVKPEYGLYTTIIAGICISLFGGSKYQIGGPTGAFIPILFAIVLQYGYENLLIAGFMAGFILVLMGLCKLGTLITYIPRPVTIGFTAGIAVLIFSGQIANFLGLSGLEKHEDFVPNMKEIALHLSTTNGYSVATAVICLTVMLIVPRVLPKVPASLIGLVVSGTVAAFFFHGKAATIGSSFGDIPSLLPQLHVPAVTWDRIITLIHPALVIAMLGSIESLLSAVVADGMTHTRHNSNRELIGQGIANMITPLFGGIPATGAIARTATNIKNGAISPMSGIMHGVVVLLVLLLFAPFASRIPLASMAPVLMLVAWNMSERKAFVRMLKTKSSDTVVLLVTFLLTVFTTVTTAVEVGLLLTIVLFAKRMCDSVKTHIVQEGQSLPQLGMVAIEGPFFFGSARSVEKSIMDLIAYRPNVVLLQMDKVPFMDLTGESHLSAVVKHIKTSGGKVLIAGIQPQPLAIIQSTGLHEAIGMEHFFEHPTKALDSVMPRANPS